MTRVGRIRIGVGGWVFEPWRGGFYPDGLAQKRELEFASRKLTSIEINGTYYGSQKPASFRKWYEETPEDFQFAVKGPRFATNRRVLAEAGESIERFFGSGVMELKEKLGPVNWQFMATKKFDAEDFAAFLALLPAEVDGRPIRHAVEVRHASFRHPEFVALAREHGVATIVARRLRLSADRRRHRALRLCPDHGDAEDEAAGYRCRRARPLGRPRAGVGGGRRARGSRDGGGAGGARRRGTSTAT